MKTRRYAWTFMVLLALTAACMAPASAVDVQWSLTPGGATGDGDDLGTAVSAIETANQANAAYTGKAVINITSNQSASVNPSPANVFQSAWHLYGGAAGTNPNNYGTVDPLGYSSVTVNGDKGGGAKAVLNGDGSHTLLKIAHVDESISVSNLVLNGGNFTDAANTLEEAYGAGLMLGVGGPGTGRAPGTITVDNVTAQNNSINITNASKTGTGNAYGAGIFVLGVDSKAGSPDHNQPGSDVVFRNVDLTSNSINFDNVSGPASVRGGGARIAYSKSFTYEGGTVESNTINASKIEHASGGGLSVDGAGFAGPVTISGVFFDRNQVTITDPGAEDNWGVARGGGFYSYVRPDPATPNQVLDISFGKNGNTNTVFKGNKVLAQRSGGGGAGPISAWGGGAYIYINQTNARFTGTKFTGNEAESRDGEGGGGAIAIDLYTGGTANGKLTVTDAIFIDNKAIGTTAAYGGAIYARADTGSGHTLTGNTYTTNSATASGALGEAYGGAITFMSGSHTLDGETFDSNVASGSTAHGGAAYFAEGSNKILASEFKANSTSGGAGFGGAVSFGAAATGTQITDTTFEDNFVKTAANKSGAGGAVYFADGQHSLSDSTFKGNSIQGQGGLGDLSGGAVHLGGMGGNTVTGVKFQGNYINALGDQNARGGSLYFQGGTTANSVDKTLVYGNRIITTDGAAHGGGIYVAGGNFELTGSSIEKNTAKSNSNSLGGGIYYGGNGELTLTNSSIVNNSLTTNQLYTAAYGSAIYASTSGVNAVVNLVAEEGKVTDISGNGINSFDNRDGIYFGNAGVGNGEGTLNIKGAGTVKVDNGIGANLAGDFTITKSDTGRFEWNGINEFNAGTLAFARTATIDLQNGDVHLGATFTAAATGNTDFNVNISKNVTLSFDPMRDSTLAMFDFSKNSGSDSMTVGDATGKTEISASIGRSVYSDSKEFTLVTGITDRDQLEAIRDGFKFIPTNSHTRSGGVYIDGESVKVGYNYISPFDNNGVNAKSAQDAMADLLTIQPPISDAEWEGILGNVRAAYPELYLDQARIVMDAVDFMARSAVDYGLRSPHRTRMITEFGYMPRVLQGETLTPYDDYGDPVGQGYIYNDGASYDSSSAYPNAILQKCGTLLPSPKGFRLWAGYAGNWQKMDSHAGLNGYKVDRNGFLIGLNYDYGPAASVGVYGGYSSSKSTAERINSTVDSDSGHFGVIGRLSPLSNYREFSLYADFGYHFANNDFNRQLGGWGAAGQFDQTIVTLGLGAEHIFRLGALNLIPHAEARFIDLDQDPMTEHGSSITTTRIDGVNKKGFNMRMGVEMSRDYFVTRGVVSPTFNLAWRHDFSNHNYASEAYYLQSPTLTRFSVQSSRIDRDSLDVGLALRTLRAVGNSSTLGVNAGYNLNLSRNSSTHSLYAGCEIGF